MTRSIPLYLSQTSECDYLDGHISQSAFLPQELPMSPALYGQLLQMGFRRSDRLVYRPQCPACQACVPSRVPVETFQMSRSQKRIWKKNQDLVIRQSAVHLDPAHFELYKKYQRLRHPESSMADFSQDDYERFICQPFCDSILIEFFLGEDLISVALADQVPNGISAVYTMFDPNVSARSLGTFAVLYHIDQARLRSLDFVYLGYWIENSRKMQYKSNFRPLEVLRENQWQVL